jgi:hypothetical protein
MGQNALLLSYEVAAHNGIGDGGEEHQVTQNYTGSFNNTASPFNPLVAENANNGIDLSLRLTEFNNGNWNSGIYTNPVDNEGTFSRSGDFLLNGPFDDLQIGVRISDTDGITLTDLDMLADDMGNFTAKSFETVGINRVRYGRLFIENTYGPETSNLDIPMQTQFWNGTNFVTNTLDNCTAFNNTLLTPFNDNTFTTAHPSSTVNGAMGLFVNGETRNLILTPPADGDPINVFLQYNIDAWLDFNWDADAGTVDNDPTATATFQLYRGNDRIIQWREIPR